MMTPSDSKERFLAAGRLLTQESTTIEKFEEIRKLIRGINPRVDRLLELCSDALSKIEKLKKGEVIELAAEQLPEKTEKEKRRKKAILFFARSWKELQSEVERVRSELADRNKKKSSQEQMASFGKIAASARGPFGIITLGAVIVAGILIYLGNNQNQIQTQIPVNTPIVRSTPTVSPTPTLIPSTSPTLKKKIKVITYEGRRIALSELVEATGPDCTSSPREVPHYHAKDRIAARALDGTMIADPGGCGFGKVSETKVEEVDE
ncbi:hypothetical protein HYU92_06165 [Candidatus Curtissbacteria bacterium]|nr:hypothetical protein [Candidatus Curtissbacteria bacterium]